MAITIEMPRWSWCLSFGAAAIWYATEVYPLVAHIMGHVR